MYDLFIVYGNYEKELKNIVDVRNNISKIDSCDIRFENTIQDLERIFNV